MRPSFQNWSQILHTRTQTQVTSSDCESPFQDQRCHNLQEQKNPVKLNYQKL